MQSFKEFLNEANKTWSFVLTRIQYKKLNTRKGTNSHVIFVPAISAGSRDDMEELLKSKDWNLIESECRKILPRVLKEVGIKSSKYKFMRSGSSNPMFLLQDDDSQKEVFVFVDPTGKNGPYDKSSSVEGFKVINFK